MGNGMHVKQRTHGSGGVHKCDGQRQTQRPQEGRLLRGVRRRRPERGSRLARGPRPLPRLRRAAPVVRDGVVIPGGTWEGDGGRRKEASRRRREGGNLSRHPQKRTGTSFVVPVPSVGLPDQRDDGWKIHLDNRRNPLSVRRVTGLTEPPYTPSSPTGTGNERTIGVDQGVHLARHPPDHRVVVTHPGDV